ncbi:DUF7503 family protein [Haladaptatus cibarius]|nr:hypothetical protein [Haladaptatus cibarius]
MATKNSIGEFVAQHPRLLGVLFALSTLLVQAGSVIADGANSGP